MAVVAVVTVAGEGTDTVAAGVGVAVAQVPGAAEGGGEEALGMAA